MEVKGTDSVAQLVEQYTFNVRVLGSNPSGITKNPLCNAQRGFFILVGMAVGMEGTRKLLLKAIEEYLPVHFSKVCYYCAGKSHL